MGRTLAVTVGVVLLGVAVVGWLRPMPGRYQLATDLRGQVTRLDTQTGRLEVFVVDRGGQLEPLDEALARDAALRGDAAARAADAEAAIQARMARMLAAGRRRPTTPREWATLREAAEFEAAREHAAAASASPAPPLRASARRP
jgi:hypothetical protein